MYVGFLSGFWIFRCSDLKLRQIRADSACMVTESALTAHQFFSTGLGLFSFAALLLSVREIVVIFAIAVRESQLFRANESDLLWQRIGILAFFSLVACSGVSASLISLLN